MHRSKLTSIVFLLVFVASPFQTALGSTAPAVTVAATFLGTSTFTITTAAHTPRIATADLHLRASGDLFTVDSLPVRMTLPLESPVTTNVVAHVNTGGRYGTLIVRLVANGDVNVATFRFLGNNGTLRAASELEYVDVVNAIFDAKAAVAAEQRATLLFQHTLARGRHPLAIGGGEFASTAGRILDEPRFDRAWNRLVAEWNAKNAVPPTVTGATPTANRQTSTQVRNTHTALRIKPAVCSPYVESPDNFIVPLQGTVYYEDHFNNVTHPLNQPGYPAYVTTNVLYENDCGTIYRVVGFDFTTGSGGYFQRRLRRVLTHPLVIHFSFSQLPLLILGTASPVRPITIRSNSVYFLRTTGSPTLAA